MDGMHASSSNCTSNNVNNIWVSPASQPVTTHTATVHQRPVVQHTEPAMRLVSLPRTVADVTLLCLLGIGLLCSTLFGTPYMRGVHCDDDTIRYPYLPDTISRLVCGIVGGGIAICALIVLEVLRIHTENKKPERFTIHEYSAGPCRLHRIIPRLYIFIGFFLFGAVMNQLITDIGKFTIGRLRPHFMDVCKPNMTLVRQECSPDPRKYIMVECTREMDKVMKDARMSFPSGHSSFSFYSMTFTVLFLQARVSFGEKMYLFKPVVQFVCISWAVFVSLSRISDYKHHWSDVLSGAALGVVVASITAVFGARLWQRREPAVKLDTQTQTGDSIAMRPIAVTGGGGAHGPAFVA